MNGTHFKNHKSDGDIFFSFLLLKQMLWSHVDKYPVVSMIFHLCKFLSRKFDKEFGISFAEIREWRISKKVHLAKYETISFSGLEVFLIDLNQS